jgi:Flp pilus assembly CpaE family ATPase
MAQPFRSCRAAFSLTHKETIQGTAQQPARLDNAFVLIEERPAEELK